MPGPPPYKQPLPIYSDTKPSTPSVVGVAIPTVLGFNSSEFISLTEMPDVKIPSTYDEALRNEELLKNIDVIGIENIQVFSGNTTNANVAFGLPSPANTNVNAFGGGVGLVSTPATNASLSTALTDNEKKVLLQNSVIVDMAGVTGDVGTYQLGTKLINSVDVATNLKSILETQANLEPIDPSVVFVEEFITPNAPDILDGGDF
jgi:hypothetical protein